MLFRSRRRRSAAFKRHPLFNEALIVFEMTVEATGENREQLEAWKAGEVPQPRAAAGEGDEGEAGGQRKRKRRRRRRRPASNGSSGDSTGGSESNSDSGDA